MAIGWRYIDGSWYYFKNDGAMNTSNMTDSLYEHPRTIYFASDGKWLYTTSLLTWNLVDSGKHLDWDGDTKYSSYVETAVSKWNAYKAGVIRKDNLFIQQDVYITDCYEDTEIAGTTYSSGEIELNTYLMDGYAKNNKLNVIIHELGHALGLGHNDDGDIMGRYNQSLIDLTKSDKKSYDAAYEQY